MTLYYRKRVINYFKAQRLELKQSQQIPQLATDIVENVDTITRADDLNALKKVYNREKVRNLFRADFKARFNDIPERVYVSAIFLIVEAYKSALSNLLNKQYSATFKVVETMCFRLDPQCFSKKGVRSHYW